MLGLTTQRKYNEMEENYKKEIENLKTSHKKEIENINIQQKNNYNSSLKAIEESYNQKLDTLTKENITLEDTIKSSEKLSKEKDKKIFALQKSNQELGASKGGLQNSLNSANQKIENLEEQLLLANNNLAAAREEIVSLSKEQLDNKEKPSVEAVKVYSGVKKDKKKYRGLTKGKRK